MTRARPAKPAVTVRRAALVTAGALAACLAGCPVGPSYRRPEAAIEPSYGELGAGSASGAGGATSEQRAA